MARRYLSGVGLLALLRGSQVAINSPTLNLLRLDVATLDQRAAPYPTPPFYEQRPLRLSYLTLRRVGGSFGPAAFGILNPLLTPTRLLTFKSGRVQRIDFDKCLDRQHTSGQLRAR